MDCAHAEDVSASRPLRLVEEPAQDIESALVSLMDRYERKLFTYLMTILRDDDVVIDCVQDTFVRAYEHLRRGRTVNAKWLYTVARNRAMDEFRRDRRLNHDEETFTRLSYGPGDIDTALDVRRAMARLPHRDREVLYLFEVAGFKTAEIGDLLGVSGSAVRQRLLRARERLRGLLDRCA